MRCHAQRETESPALRCDLCLRVAAESEAMGTPHDRTDCPVHLAREALLRGGTVQHTHRAESKLVVLAFAAVAGVSDSAHHSNFLSHHLFHHLPGLPFSFASRAFSPCICMQTTSTAAPHCDQGAIRTRACIHASVFPSLKGSTTLSSDSRRTGTRVLRNIDANYPHHTRRRSYKHAMRAIRPSRPFGDTGPSDNQSVRSSANLLRQLGQPASTPFAYEGKPSPACIDTVCVRRQAQQRRTTVRPSVYWEQTPGRTPVVRN